MTKPVTRKMAVDCLLWLVQNGGLMMIEDEAAKEFQTLEYIPAFRCYICKKPILPGQVIQFDHLHADVHGGPHEYQNLRPVHYDPCHKKKTGKDVKANGKVKRIAAGGRKRRGQKMVSRPFSKIHKPFPKRSKENAK